MDAGLRAGTFWSGIGHALAVLWVLLGDWLFVPHPEIEISATQVSMISGAEFAALLASSPAPSPTAPEVPPQVESAAPEHSPTPPSRPEQPPATAASEEEVPQAASGPGAGPVAPAPEAAPESDAAPVPDIPAPDEPAPEDVALAPVEQPLPAMTSSPNPRPRPAERIAPTPDEPLTPSPTDEAAPAISDEPADEVAPAEEPEPEPAPEDAGDVLRTEATEEQDEALGMTSSPAPRPRPASLARPAPDAAAPAEGASAQGEAPTGIAEEDAIAEAVAAAAAAAADSSPAQASAGSTVSGPPLNAGEIGDIRSAIAGKWNLGSVSSDVLRTVITVRVEFGPDGKPGAITLIERDGPSADAVDVAFAAARRAIQRAYVEGGIPLPPDKYETWKVMEFVFDANGMRMR